MKRYGPFFIVVCLSLLSAARVFGDDGAPAIESPPYPAWFTQKHDEGKVVTSIAFDDAGKVQRCQVVSCSASQALGDYTRSFILAHWHSYLLAGKTVNIPFTYILPQLNAQSSHYPHPPYPRAALVHKDSGTIIFLVIFGNDGRVASCEILGSNASPLLQEYTRAFYLHEWFSKECAGRVFIFPIIFDPGQPLR